MTEITSRLSTALADRYRIERELGSGGMAIVYLAHDVKPDRKVAVKVLKPELSAILGGERFLSEIKVTANLQHPNILPLFDSGEADGFLYYVLPYIEGETLREKMNRERQLSVDTAIEIIQQVGKALDYAHRRGVVHRDVKPENILLHEGEVLVADFGLAIALDTAGGDRLTATGVSVGTPAYMSPEQASGDAQLDGRSDLYALGCIVYEMLAGHPPFVGGTAQAVLARHMTDSVPPLRTVRAGLAANVVDAVERALDKTPSDRCASAAEFVRALLARDTGRGGVQAKSIAVLPFANPGQVESEYFADGMTDEIINALANVPGLRVIARTSVFAFKGTNSDVREIGKQLGVGTVLEGSVRTAGKRLRITAQLVDASDGHHLWSERYDRELEDVFAIQDEIAAIIARRLQATYGAPPRRERPTENLDAYEAYLRGRFYWSKGTLEGYARSVKHYERAVALDPEFAQAYIGLAETLIYWALSGGPRDLFPRAKAMTLKALDLDDTLADAHATLGYIKFWFEWEWAGAIEGLERAIALNPNSALAHNSYSGVLANLGRPQDAVTHSRRTIELDPLWLNANQTLQFALFQAGDYTESIAYGNKALELAPDYLLALLVMGCALLEIGSLDEAEGAFRRTLSISQDDAMARAGLAQVYVRTGRREDALECARGLEQRAAAGAQQSAVSASWAHAALGNVDEAFRWIDRAIEARDPFMVWLPSSCWWDPLRADPRFEGVLHRLKFPEWSYKQL